MSSKQGKSLLPEDEVRARAILESIVKIHFGGSQTKAAEGLDVSQPTIHAAVKGKAGFGPKLLAAMSRFTDRPIVDLGVKVMPRAKSPTPPALVKALESREWSAIGREYGLMRAALTAGADTLSTEQWIAIIESEERNDLGLPKLSKGVDEDDSAESRPKIRRQRKP